MEVYSFSMLWLGDFFLNFINEFGAFLETEGIREGKKCCLTRGIVECVLKLKNKLVRLNCALVTTLVVIAPTSSS
jgi:hypothetical protein